MINLLIEIIKMLKNSNAILCYYLLLVAEHQCACLKHAPFHAMLFYAIQKNRSTANSVKALILRLRAEPIFFKYDVYNRGQPMDHVY